MTVQERERSAIPEEYLWDLAPLYADEEAWRLEREAVTRDIASLRAWAGTLGESGATLAEALEATWRVGKTLSRLGAYAGMRGDEDTREDRPQAMEQEMQALYASFGAQVSYVEPEILGIGQTTIHRFLAAEERLQPVRFFLDDIFRRAEHTLTDGEERILAEAMPLASAPSMIQGIFSNADFLYPTVTLSDGSTKLVNQSGYAELRTSPIRADRQRAMVAFFEALGQYSRTFGTTLNASVQKALFFAKARRYDSALERALDAAHIPTSVYHGLIAGVRRHLPTLHRYLALRKRMLGIQDALRYHDLYAPLVPSVDLTYTPEEAHALVMASMRPLGDEYVAVLGRAFAERWVDWYPTTGKRSGAYSQGAAYDVHPYMLLNFLGQFHDVSTLAHELGHTMHSYFSNRHQPFALADYPIFVAEVASTFNEDLLIEHMLENVHDPATRMSLLGNYLEGIKATVFRQTQFAEFELAMHERAQRGEAITGEALATAYLALTREYYGHEAGVVQVDDCVAHEWSYIPHFYSEFYVYQYATSLTASAALAAKVRGGGDAERVHYLQFLSAGGSQYPIDLLKRAGVDMTTGEPLDLTIAKMNRVMDEIEVLLG